MCLWAHGRGAGADMSVGRICKYAEVNDVYMLGKTCERNAKVFTVCVC